MKGIEGRVAVVTGGARGIGLATAQALRAAGAKVAVGDVDEEALADAAGSLGRDVVAARLDVSRRESFEAFLELTERDLGPLDILVNNAGIMPIGPMLAESDETAARVMDVNIRGPLIGMKLALPGMIGRGSGHIVNVASAAGRSPVPGGASYAATKAALVSLTETARVEHRGTGVHFTCAMPSFTATDLIAGTKGTKFIGTVTPEDVGAAVVSAIAKRRKDVFVPRSVGVVLRLTPLIGRRLRDAVNRSLGADRTFLDIDSTARAEYVARIADTRARGDGDTSTAPMSQADPR